MKGWLMLALTLLVLVLLVVAGVYVLARRQRRVPAGPRQPQTVADLVRMRAEAAGRAPGPDPVADPTAVAGPASEPVAAEPAVGEAPAGEAVLVDAAVAQPEAPIAPPQRAPRSAARVPGPAAAPAPVVPAPARVRPHPEPLLATDDAPWTRAARMTGAGRARHEERVGGSTGVRERRTEPGPRDATAPHRRTFAQLRAEWASAAAVVSCPPAEPAVTAPRAPAETEIVAAREPEPAAPAEAPRIIDPEPPVRAEPPTRPAAEAGDPAEAESTPAARRGRPATPTAAERAATQRALLRTFGVVAPAAPVSLRSAPERQPTGRAGAAQPVEVRVVARDGTALAGAAATLLDDHGAETAAATTDHDGRGRLTAPGPGSYVLVAAADGHQPGAVALTVGDARATAEIPLARSASLDGAVTGEDGPVAGARVVLLQDGEEVDSARTGPDGGYRFADLTGGRYGLAVTAEECESAAALVTVADEAAVRHDVTLLPSDLPEGAEPMGSPA